MRRCEAGEAGSGESLHDQQTVVDKAVMKAMHGCMKADRNARALELAPHMQRLSSLGGEMM